jgi:amino acid adenylation domain-containing protein
LTGYPFVRSLLAVPSEWEARVAFSATGGVLSFGALRAGMLAFAGWLVREAGIRPGDRVAICLPKSLEMVVVLHGVLAAGAAFVGLPHRGPAGKLAEIVAATRPRLIITARDMGAHFAPSEGGGSAPPVLFVDSIEGGAGLAALLDAARPLADAVPVEPDEPAAIVFTSGSTGEPKGVVRTQRNFANNIRSHIKGEALGARDVRLGNTPLHYISPNLFYPATCGLRIHLLSDQDVMFPEVVAETVERERVTTWASAATALRLLIERGELARRNLSNLRLVKSYGERISPELLREVVAAFPQAQFQATYGATEAPNIALYVAPRPLTPDMASVPLGRIEPDYRVLLCDEAGLEVPLGEVGEICAIGPSVTPGYWNDPDLTRARQLEGRPDSYRTGDLGFLDKGGVLHFAGRRDHMVKVRGHRLDLAEVEAALRQHPSVRDAAALLVNRSDGESEIAAALEAEPRGELEAEIGRICAERLPRYAWPASIRYFSVLPRLPNGKIDRLRLTDAGQSAAEAH